MEGMLEEAKATGADNVEKLERAVAKNVDRVKRAEQALAEAQGAGTPAPDTSVPAAPPAKAETDPPREDRPDLEALQKQLDQARDKLEKMAGMLDDAREAGGDNVEKLERAVAKNEVRVQRAEDALADARRQLATETGE